jgi:predicted DNA-binding transcriptional regulator AlpA
MQPVTKLRLVPSGLVSVKALAAQYGVSKSTLYELVKSDPTFPYKNVGLRKKFMIDAAEFKIWLEARTEKQKDDHFGLPTASGLLEKYGK